MIYQMTNAQRKERLLAAGLPTDAVDAWIGAVEGLKLPEKGDAASLDGDAKRAAEAIGRGWALLERMPVRSKRSEAERVAGETVTHLCTDVCWNVVRAYAEPMYRRLTDDFTRHVRVDDLCWRAAELWPGLLPTRDAVEKEADERVQADKDGLELFQGAFLGQLMCHRAIGLHMMNAMLRPRQEALDCLEEFKRTGRMDLGPVLVEAHGQTGYVYFRHNKYLNAEDEETLHPQEIAVDLVLLHPDLRMGVLRGDFVDHPRYKGRRVYSAGINLTRLYHGKIPYLFYIVRDMGLVNKLYRGLAEEDFTPDQPERTLEKPWMSVVEAFAIGGGCQLLLVMDYVIAEAGSYFNLPARKEGIIPGVANLRLPRFVGERQARAGIMFDKTFFVDSPDAAMMINEVVPRGEVDEAVEKAVSNAVGSGMVSAGGNRKAIRVQTEPLNAFREYMAAYAREQAFCHLSEQLIANLERNWQAKERRLIA